MVTPKRVGHLAVQGGRSCLHTDTADQQTLRKAPKPLVTPVVPLKACWLNRTEMSCYFSQLSAVTDRGEFDESLIPGFPPLLGVGTVDICETLIPGFPPLLGVGTVDICCEQPTGKGRNVQRLPVPRFHPKQGCQAQIANQIDKGRILQDRRLPLSSPKGQNHLG